MQFPNAEKLPLLAEAGFSLIPLHQWDAVGERGRKVGKAPVGKDWWSSPPMTVDEAADHMRTGGNVGIPLGKPIGDLYLCCYDVDLGNLPNGVKDVPRLVNRIAADLGATVDDLVIHQSGNDGLHVFFMSGEADLRGFAEVDGVKVEIKSKGQQVVAPGSIHPDTGRPYQVHPDSAAHRRLPVAPETLVERLRKPTSSYAGPQTLPPSRVDDPTPRTEFKLLPAEELDRSVKTANDLIIRHIPESKDRAAKSNSGRLDWREAEPSSTSPRAELIRNAEATSG